MNALRRLLGSGTKPLFALIAALLGAGAGIYAVVSYLQDGTPDTAHSSMFICTETGKTFRHTNEIGEMQPIHSPFSGRDTGVPAEPCYWTRDGGIKSEPTWVLLNELAGKPGPTFCPDCGRLVVGHNPPAEDGHTPPPTQREYEARAAAKRATTESKPPRDDAR
jgi:hypothetical protein